MASLVVDAPPPATHSLQERQGPVQDPLDTPSDLTDHSHHVPPTARPVCTWQWTCSNSVSVPRQYHSPMLMSKAECVHRPAQAVAAGRVDMRLEAGGHGHMECQVKAPWARPVEQDTDKPGKWPHYSLSGGELSSVSLSLPIHGSVCSEAVLAGTSDASLYRPRGVGMATACTPPPRSLRFHPRGGDLRGNRLAIPHVCPLHGG